LFDAADPNGGRGAGVIAGQRALLDDASSRLLADRKGGRARVRRALAEKIGDLYRQLGSYDRAAALFELALETSESDGNGANSNDTARILVRIADLERERGHYEKAEAAATRSVEIRTRLYGRQHPEVADSLNVTGILMQIRGRREEAEAVFREAVEIRRKVLEPNHPLLALSLGNLGNILRDKGDLLAARRCFEEALAIRRRHWGNEHPRVASSLGQLSQIAMAEKRFDDAVRLTEEGVRISRKAYESGNPDLARVLLHHGNALAEVGRLRESEAALLEALAIQTKARGAEATEVSFVETALASTYLRMRREDDAERLHRHAVAVREKNLGSANPVTIGARLKLGDILLARHRAMEAAAVFREVLAGKPNDADRLAAEAGLRKAGS
jgi:serine/threonine-protein kinase